MSSPDIKDCDDLKKQSKFFWSSIALGQALNEYICIVSNQIIISISTRSKMIGNIEKWDWRVKRLSAQGSKDWRVKAAMEGELYILLFIVVVYLLFTIYCLLFTPWT